MVSNDLSRAKYIEEIKRYIKIDLKQWENVCKGDILNCIFVSDDTFMKFKRAAIDDLNEKLFELDKEFANL